MSSFTGLNTALTALRAQRRGLDVTAQNIANANTEGYTRQRVNLEAVGAPAVAAIVSRYDGPGTGVTVADVARLRDAFLEQRGSAEHGRLAQLTVRQSTLAQVEDTFGEPSDTGVQAQLSDLWNGWHDVANRPGDLAARSQLLQRAETLGDTVRRASVDLDAQWVGARDELVTLVDEVNTTARTVAELNGAIRRDTQAGLSPNEMSDRRDLLVQKLADLVGGSPRPGEDGIVDVYVGGSPLVVGDTANAVTLGGASNLAGAGSDPARLSWGTGTYAVPVQGGAVAGRLEALNSLLPAYSQRLDAFAVDLATQVNAVHATGYTLDGSAGGAFFSATSARDFRVAVSEPAGVAASGTPGGTVDGSTASAVAALAAKADGPDAGYRRLIVDLGVDSQTAQRRAEIQNVITTQVDSSRDAQAGVDLDEEMVAMLSYQRAYEGAARVMTAIDQALEKLINATGVVGR